MVVAMIAMWMVQTAVDQIVDVVAMGHSLVAASRTVNMFWLVPHAGLTRRADIRVRGRDFNHMLIDVASMHVMEVAIMQIVDMVPMFHSRVAASWPVLMAVIGMVWKLAVRHLSSPFHAIHHT